jgi:hypothetical protein
MANDKTSKVTVEYSEMKLTALNGFLAEKGESLAAEMEAFVDSLYEKKVPKDAKTLINMTLGQQAPPKKPPQAAAPGAGM